MRIILLWVCSLMITPALFGDHVVVIDPGHGGKKIPFKSDGTQKGDGSSWNNATSAGGLILEKELTLEYAKEISRALKASPRAQKLKIKTILTRGDDRHLSSMGRAAVAVENTASIFLSLHFNGSLAKNAYGTRGYVVSKDHPKWEFMHFVNPYHERDRAFSDLVIRKVAEALKVFGGDPTKAKTVGDSAGDGGHLKDGIRTLGFARQDTHLFKAVIMLLEVEFIDHPEVAKWLLSPENREPARKAVARAIVTAICDHLENDTPPAAPRKAR